MNVNDSDAQDYENDPRLLEPGVGSKRLPPRTSRLGGAIPIRFTPEMIERIKAVAQHDGVSVSSWVRGEVERSLSRREQRGLRVASVSQIPSGAAENALRVARRSRRPRQVASA